MDKIVAIVGRPNVGKSTLFNRLIGKNIAIVHETAGVTRDRNYGEAEWNGKKFFIIDTGGYVPQASSAGDTFESAIREQVIISIEESDIVLFLVDGQTGLTPFDLELASVLRREMSRKENEGKKVLLVVNKIDRGRDEEKVHEFHELGLGEPIMVSALVGRMSGDLLDTIVNGLSFAEKGDEGKEDTSPKFAVIGRPNVGKSSLVNAIVQKERNIVTDIPGTTRDSIDTVIKYYGQDITFIDTAGLRKKSKIRRAESLEFFSTIRTHRSIESCDVVILVIDAATIYTKLEKSSDLREAVYKLNKEDVEILQAAAELKKGILVVINKWDLIEKDSDTAKIFEDKIKEHLKTFNYLPIIFISAKTKQRVSKVIDSAMKVYNERKKEVKTSRLNDVLGNIIKETPPVGKTRREIKINYITQVQTGPPVIAFYTNLPSEIEEHYKRFLENKTRLHFGFEGVPLTLTFKKKN